MAAHYGTPNAWGSGGWGGFYQKGKPYPADAAPFVNLGHGHIMVGRHGHSLQELEHWRGSDLGREVLHMAVSLRTGRRVCLVMTVSVHKEALSNYSPKDCIS